MKRKGHSDEGLNARSRRSTEHLLMNTYILPTRAKTLRNTVGSENKTEHSGRFYKIYLPGVRTGFLRTNGLGGGCNNSQLITKNE